MLAFVAVAVIAYADRGERRPEREVRVPRRVRRDGLEAEVELPLRLAGAGRRREVLDEVLRRRGAVERSRRRSSSGRSFRAEVSGRRLLVVVRPRAREVDPLVAVVVDRVGGEAVADAVVHLDAEVAAVREDVVRPDEVVVVAAAVDDADAGRVAEVERVGAVRADEVAGDGGRRAVPVKMISRRRSCRRSRCPRPATCCRRSCPRCS